MFLLGIKMGINIVCTLFLTGTRIGVLVKLQNAK